jgi:hypothetical protein
MLPKQPKNIRAGLDFSLGSVHGLVIDYMLRQTHSGDDNLLFKHLIITLPKTIGRKESYFLGRIFQCRSPQRGKPKKLLDQIFSILL